MWVLGNNQIKSGYVLDSACLTEKKAIAVKNTLVPPWSRSAFIQKVEVVNSDGSKTFRYGIMVKRNP